MKRCYATLLAFASISSCPAQELGRLFFTPEQRAQLERGIAPPRPLPPLLNGMVERSDGTRTLWLDGIAQSTRAGTSPSEQRSQPIKVGERLHEDAAP